MGPSARNTRKAKKVFLPEVILLCAAECGNVTSLCFELCLLAAILLDP